jgi:hypothetical protein
VNTRIARLHRNALVLRLSLAMVRAEINSGSIGKRRAAGKAAYPDSAATEWLQEGDDEQENDDASW